MGDARLSSSSSSSCQHNEARHTEDELVVPNTNSVIIINREDDDTQHRREGVSKRVRFLSSCELRFFPKIRHGKEERRIWYQEDDFKAFRKETRVIGRLLRSVGIVRLVEELGADALLGLENSVFDEIVTLRNEWRSDAYDLVLGSQEERRLSLVPQSDSTSVNTTASSASWEHQVAHSYAMIAADGKRHAYRTAQRYIPIQETTRRTEIARKSLPHPSTTTANNNHVTQPIDDTLEFPLSLTPPLFEPDIVSRRERSSHRGHNRANPSNKNNEYDHGGIAAIPTPEILLTEETPDDLDKQNRADLHRDTGEEGDCEIQCHLQQSEERGFEVYKGVS